ncbi:hypothetical protein PENTCL1PPCAC_13612, partial [Pristionchus entomophagus]
IMERSWKDKIVGWKDAELRNSEIVRKCHEMGKKVSHSQVTRILNKNFDVKKPYTPSSILDKDNVMPIFDLIKAAFLEDSQAKVSDLVKEIKIQFDEKLSETVVKRMRKELGMERGNVRYGHSVRLANRAPRLSFCELHLNLGTMFLHHCFTDESLVYSVNHGRFVYIVKGDNSRRVKPRVKHPPSLMVWGGISWEGATPLVVLRSGVSVDSGVYQTMIHQVYLDWA